MSFISRTFVNASSYPTSQLYSFLPPKFRFFYSDKAFYFDSGGSGADGGSDGGANSIGIGNGDDDGGDAGSDWCGIGYGNGDVQAVSYSIF